MATTSKNMNVFYRQKKNSSASTGKKSTKSPSPKHAATFGSDITQPPALVCHGGSLDLKDDFDEQEQVLRQFDMNMAYGPCVGITRLDRWERAQRMGLNPPKEIESLLRDLTKSSTRKSHLPWCMKMIRFSVDLTIGPMNLVLKDCNKSLSMINGSMNSQRCMLMTGQKNLVVKLVRGLWEIVRLITGQIHMMKGQELFRKGLLREAVLALEAEVMKNPENAEGWRLLVITHAENDDDQQAIAAMMRAQEADPTNLEVLLALGVGHTNELEQTAAIKYLYGWLRHHPKYGTLAPPELANSLYYADALDLKPNYVRAWANMGISYTNQTLPRHQHLPASYLRSKFWVHRKTLH